MEIAGLSLAIVVVLAVASFLIEAGFLVWGAKLAGIQGRSFGKAIGTLILSGIAGALLTLVAGGLLGPLGGLLITALIMMALFRTSFLRALAATALAGVLGFLVFGGLVLLAGISGFFAFAGA